MHRVLAIFLLLTALGGDAQAGTYYVAANGTPNTEGSRDNPWPSVEFALVMRGGGNTIVVRPGVYRGPLSIGSAYGGSARRPTVIRSEEKWKAVIVGSPENGISVRENCDWVTIDGFEVLGARGFGVCLDGNHNTLRNCWIHHHTRSGVLMQHCSGGVIEDNLIEFNGCHVQFDHGVYVNGSRHTVRGNIVRHNAGFGLHFYPELSASLVAYNLVYGEPIQSGVLVACGKGGPNRILQNTIFGHTSALAICNGDGVTVANNILVGGSDPIALENSKQILADYNLCWPKSKHDGLHDVVAEPQLFNVTCGLFWLTPQSPAIGKGSTRYALSTDFWGRPVAKDKAPDLGAFAFVPSLLDPRSRSRWYHDWAYGYSPVGSSDMPDLWILPKAFPTGRSGKASSGSVTPK